MTTLQLHPPRRASVSTAALPGELTGRLSGRPLALPLAFATAYLVVAYLGRLTAVEGSDLALVWPAAGLGALWFLWTPARMRVLNSALLVTIVLVTAVVTDAPTWLRVFGTVSHLVMTLLIAELLRPWWDRREDGRRPRIDSPHALAVVIGASLAGTLASAVIGSVGNTFFADGSTRLDVELFGLWFGRNLCGTLVVLAVALTWPDRAELTRRLGAARTLELLVVFAVTSGTYVAVFLNGSLPIAFTLLVGTVWIGVRFSPWASAVHTVVVGTATIAATLLDSGPFAHVSDVQGRSLIAQGFVLTVAVTGLALAAERAQTERYQRRLEEAEDSALGQAAFLQGVMSTISEGIVVLDHRGGVLYSNQAADDLAATSPGVADDVPGLDNDRGREALAEAHRGRTTTGLEVTQRREHDERVLTVTTLPLGEHPTAESPVPEPFAVVVVADSTSAHAQRAQLAAFAGTVAHDLRSPLSGIDGWAEILAEAVDEADVDQAPLDLDLVRRAVTRVRASSNQMQELITDLLVHATTRDRQLRTTEIALADVVAEVAAELQVPLAADAMLGHHVLADRSMVKQLLHNLVGNAHKYVAPGVVPQVSVRAETRDGRVHVRVDDNGIGIPEADLEKVFDEFHRAHPTGYAGSGLGLAICRRIVHRHGGVITASPRTDGGTTIEFSLPAVSG